MFKYEEKVDQLLTTHLRVTHQEHAPNLREDLLARGHSAPLIAKKCGALFSLLTGGNWDEAQTEMTSRGAAFSNRLTAIRLIKQMEVARDSDFSKGLSVRIRAAKRERTAEKFQVGTDAVILENVFDAVALGYAEAKRRKTNQQVEEEDRIRLAMADCRAKYIGEFAEIDAEFAPVSNYKPMDASALQVRCVEAARAAWVPADHDGAPFVLTEKTAADALQEHGQSVLRTAKLMYVNTGETVTALKTKGLAILNNFRLLRKDAQADKLCADLIELGAEVPAMDRSTYPYTNDEDAAMVDGQ